MTHKLWPAGFRIEERISPMTAPIMSYEDFEPFTGDRFVILDSDRPMELVDLIEVAPLKNYNAPGAGRAPFSLLFKSSAQSSPPLPQKLYRMVHDDMGELEIFLVPISRDASGVTYEAAFN
jgi:hypothetical protein